MSGIDEMPGMGNMTKYIIQFTVRLEEDVTDLIMYRAIIAKDEDELSERIRILERVFMLHYDETWNMNRYWQIPEDTPLDQMAGFLLSDDLTGWENRADNVDVVEV